MASLRSPTLRRVVSGAAPYLRTCQQRRWAQVHDVRFLTTQQTPNRVLEKYREKLDRKAKEEGLRDINELKEAYKEKIKLHKKSASIEGVVPDLDSLDSLPPSPSTKTSSSPFPAPPPPPQAPVVPKQPPGIKNLSSYLDVDKALGLPAQELEAIWRLRHANNPRSLAAVIPHSVYSTIASTAKRHPHFILPLPKEGEGAHIHFLQWGYPAPDTVTVLFTHLAEYKLRGEHAEPHTVITHHLEMAKDKGVVMMIGEVVEGKGVSVDEAKYLVMCLQKFYGIGGEKAERKRLLEQFSGGDATFKLDELVSEAEAVV